MLNKSRNSGHPCLVPDFGEKAYNPYNLSLFDSDICCKFVSIVFIMLMYIPSISNLLMVCIMKRCILSVAFPAFI